MAQLVSDSRGASRVVPRRDPNRHRGTRCSEPTYRSCTTPSLHTARVHLAWQQDDVAGVLFLLSRHRPHHTLPVEETLQRGWAYFKRGASGKAIGAARRVLTRHHPVSSGGGGEIRGHGLARHLPAQYVDTALNPVQKELEATIDAIARVPIHTRCPTSASGCPMTLNSARSLH